MGSACEAWIPGVGEMVKREFEEQDVPVRRGWRRVTLARQVRVAEGRLTLLNSWGAEMESAPLSQVRVHSPWYVPRGCVRAVLGGTAYLLGLGPVRARDVEQAAAGSRCE
ncbi:hypothetical protein [Streptomyces sp. NPDC002851]